MKIPLSATLTAVIGMTIGSSPCAAERPEGLTCDDQPDGYCHTRTEKDKAFVRYWNENVGPGSNRGNGNATGKPFNLRRKLPEVSEPPGYTPFAPGEYEPVEGILLAFDGSYDGSSAYDLDVVANIAAAVTKTGGAKVFMVANAAQRPVAAQAFDVAAVNMTKVEWIVEDINSVWIRDYGPRFICDPISKSRAAVDTRYYSNRPLDNRLPVELGTTANEPTFGHNNHDLNSQVLHSGGNAHYFSHNRAFATRLLLRDNSGLEEQKVKDYWKLYKGVELHLFDQLSFNVDGTGHVDMWFLPVDDSKVIIGEWEKEDRYGSKAITDGAAAYMQDKGYTVYRVPNWNAKSRGQNIHFTYTNAIIANEIVVLSKFGDSRDEIALSRFETAFPSKKIVQVDSRSIIERSGALHCIAQHVYDCSKSAPTEPPQAPNQDPIAVAKASPDTVTDNNESVTLDGNDSSDPDGTIQSYVWTDSSGELGRGSSLVIKINVDFLPKTFTLTVTDDQGATGVDTVQITLEDNGPGPTCVGVGGNCKNGACCAGLTCPAGNPKKCFSE